MRRSVLCVLATILLCLAVVPKPALAQSFEVEDVTMTRTNYPSVKSSEGPVKVYVGNWDLGIAIRNYDKQEYLVTIRIFLDNLLIKEDKVRTAIWDVWSGYYPIDPFYSSATVSFSKSGEREITVQVWYGWFGEETQPRNTYSFNVTVVKPEVSDLQASSRVVRALGDNSLAVSFTNGGNENMRQAVLSVADSNGLTVTPNSVELGDVNPGEQVSENFTVTSPASVTLGTAQVRFSLSFIDYAGISHTEDVSGTVEVYRLSPALTVSAPSEVENGATVEIAATLKNPEGDPINNENITLTAGGVTLGVFKTDSGGVARASYRATETGTLNVGASFSGSASYDATSTSGEFTVTPAAAFPYWAILLIALPMALAAVLMIWRRRRREVARRSKKR
jgi:hypothetical protein